MSSPLRNKTTATANTPSKPANTPSKPAPWSLSKTDRFGGYGSQYKSEGTTPRKTPGKVPRASAGDTRYATPGERAVTPAKEVKPQAAFASVTDRFALPGSHFAAAKLQAAVRRRQSALGVVTSEETKKAAPCIISKRSAGPTAGMRAAGTACGERFAGPSSIYGSATPGKATPGIGEYNPAVPMVGSGRAAAAAFKGDDDRFERHDSIYVPAASEDTYFPPSDAAGAVPKRDEATAAFAPSALGGHADRFGPGNGSIYDAMGTSQAAPGVGRYEADGESIAIASEAVSERGDSATFASKTDRFALPGSHIKKSAAPGVGVYEPSDEAVAARVRGAVKLQAAIRRRQSRGIFRALETEAASKPAPDFYAPEVLPPLPPVPEHAAPSAPAAEAKDEEDVTVAEAAEEAAWAEALEEHAWRAAYEEKAWREAHAEHAWREAHAEKAVLEAARAADKALLKKAVAHLEEKAAAEEAAAAAWAEAHEEHAWRAAHAEKAWREAHEEHAWREAHAEAAEREAAATAGGAYVPFSLDAEELASSPVVRQPAKGRLSQVVTLDQWLAESDDEKSPPVRESVAVAKEALMTAVGTVTAAPAVPTTPSEGDAADGDWLFSQLDRISSQTPSRVAREDYFCQKAGWDLDGLRSDLAVYMQNEPEAAAEAAELN